MHFRQKLTFMAIGSILTLAGYLLATLGSDVSAQSETDKSVPTISNKALFYVEAGDNKRKRGDFSRSTGYNGTKNH